MDSALIDIPYTRPGRTARQTFDWALANARVADEAGVTEMMIAEHATQLWENIPSPELVIAAAATQTKRIRFAPMAHLLPNHHPSNLAIMVGWLSQVLEGRYFLGVGAGAYPDSALVHGIPPDMSESAARVRESLEIMEKIWKREPFKHVGKFYKAGFPEDPRDHDPNSTHLLSDFSPWGGKIEIAVSGLSLNSPSIKFAGEMGYKPVSFFSGAAVLKNHWQTYEQAALANSHTPHRKSHRVSLDIFVADTDKEARRLALNGPIGYCWEHYLLPLYKRFNLLASHIADSGAHESDVNLEWLCDNMWICGSPATVREKVEALMDKTGGWGTLMMPVHDFSDDPEPWFQSVQLFAQEVAPKIKLPFKMS